MEGVPVVIVDGDRELLGVVGGRRFNLLTGQVELAVHTTSFIYFRPVEQVRAA